MKICPTCKLQKALNEFNVDKSRNLGVTAQCKVCRAAVMKKHNETNAEKRKAYQAEWRLENAEYLKQKGAKRRLEKRAMCLIAAARVRSRAKNITYDLDGFADELQSRIDAGFCELSGARFDLSPGRKARSPSLDRIRPELGYVPTNVRVICHALNAALGDWGEDELHVILNAWFLE